MIPVIRDIEVLLDFAELLPTEEALLEHFAQQPYAWMKEETPRRRHTRQRLFDRGLIDVQGTLGIDRKYRLSQKGRLYLGIPEDILQN